MAQQHYDSAAYKALRRRFRQHCQYRGLRCHMCREPIDYSLKRPHPRAFQLDHAMPLSTHPQLACDWLNARPSHAVCNQSRGDGPLNTSWTRPDW